MECSEKDLYCQECSLQFDKKFEFDVHLSVVHGEFIIKDLYCQVCSLQFDMKAVLCSFYVFTRKMFDLDIEFHAKFFCSTK